MSYNPLRQLTELKDWLGSTRMELDSMGRPTKVTNHKDKTVNYTWGVLGEKRSVTYPDGKVVTYDYDEFYRLSQVDDEINKVAYQYNSHCLLSQKAFHNDVKTTYSYDSIGRLHELSNFDAKGLVDKIAYEYNLTGNKSKITKERQNLPEDSGIFEYAYDPLNRLKEVIRDGTTLGRYSYDGYGNRTALRAGNNSTSYAYNALNQLISTVDIQTNDIFTGDIQTDDIYTSDVHTDDFHVNLIDAGNFQEMNSQSFTYDKRGNLVETFKNNTLTHQYHFGALNRLEKAFNHEKQLGATYKYNGLGHRVAKTEGRAVKLVQPTGDRFIEPVLPTATQPKIPTAVSSVEPVLPTKGLELPDIHPTKQVDDVLDLSRKYNNLLQREENQSTTSYTWDFNVLSARTENGDYYNYLQDNLGSPMGLFDKAGETQETFGYDEFGRNLHEESNLSDQPFTYTGYQRDDITGTYFA
jgi:YD repeat-containing protein